MEITLQEWAKQNNTSYIHAYKLYKQKKINAFKHMSGTIVVKQESNNDCFQSAQTLTKYMLRDLPQYIQTDQFVIDYLNDLFEYVADKYGNYKNATIDIEEHVALKRDENNDEELSELKAHLSHLFDRDIELYRKSEARKLIDKQKAEDELNEYNKQILNKRQELINKLKNEGFKSFKRADLDSAPEKLYELKKDNNSSQIKVLYNRLLTRLSSKHSSQNTEAIEDLYNQFVKLKPNLTTDDEKLFADNFEFKYNKYKQAAVKNAAKTVEEQPASKSNSDKVASPVQFVETLIKDMTFEDKTKLLAILVG